VTTESRKPTRRRRGGRRRKPREASPPPEPIAPEPPAPVEPAPEPASALLPLAEPELVFAARLAARPPEPERPLPSTRRAIFFDVENTSRVQHISRVIEHLAVDRLGRRTDFIAVGNWRVIGHDTARLLAGHGAQLLHSAPSVGVKDWSDLRIAVAAGVWLGTARPGDVLEVISDDRAFDAVGDVATSLGITFRRLSYRRLTGVAAPMPPSPVAEPQPEPRGDSRGGRRRRGRRGGYRREGPPAPAAAPVHALPPPQAARPGAEEPHSAPHDELLGVARDLIQRSSGNVVTLDSLANALKARGFSRPPGSPRLITRLRRIRELEVSRSGQITLVDGSAAPPIAGREPSLAQGDERAEDHDRTEDRGPAQGNERVGGEDRMADRARTEDQEPAEDNEPTPGNEWSPADGPRERTYEDRRAAVEAAQRAAAPSAAPPSDGAPGDGQPRRRSRRGGRRRRRHGAPAS